MNKYEDMMDSNIPTTIIEAIKMVAEGSLNNDQSIIGLCRDMTERIVKLQDAVIALNARLESLESFVHRIAPKH